MSRPRIESALLHNRLRLVRVGKRILPFVPEQASRAGLARLLRRTPEMWGWSTESERRRYACRSYRCAFPQEDYSAFMSELIAQKASGLATSITYLTRKDPHRTGHNWKAALSLSNDAPCLITYLHYTIDPLAQLVFLAHNPHFDWRWAVFPIQPGEELRWEDERALLLADSDVSPRIAERFLSVTHAGWLVNAVRHMRRGGSVLIAMDAPLDSRRVPSAALDVGCTSMPLSPAIEVLARERGVRLIFLWPEEVRPHTWALRCSEWSDPTQLAAAASRWIAEHPTQWAGWPYVTWRHSPVEMRRQVRSR
jgi:hypothetical protein